MYPKVKGDCIICGARADLYQQREESGFREWCEACHKRYRFLHDHRLDDMDTKTLFRDMMAQGRDVR